MYPGQGLFLFSKVKLALSRLLPLAINTIVKFYPSE